MDFKSRKTLSLFGALALLAVAGAMGFNHFRQEPRDKKVSDSAEAGSAIAVSAPAVLASSASPAPAKPVSNWQWSNCLRKGIAISLGQANLRVPGPPALTVIIGTGVEDEIDFSTRGGLEKACLFPNLNAKAIALNFEGMDKERGIAADWRGEFCGEKADPALQFLCLGEERAKDTPRRLAVAALYDPKAFDGEGMFQHAAPSMANFLAWKERLTKAGTPPPVSADGAFDAYPGNVWLERNTGSRPPLLFSCDTDGSPATGRQYCIGSLEFESGLHARIEFRTNSSEVGAGAADALARFRALLAAWRV